MEQNRILFRPFFKKIIVLQWNADLSPWKTPAVSKNGRDFADRADQFFCIQDLWIM